LLQYVGEMTRNVLIIFVPYIFVSKKLQSTSKGFVFEVVTDNITIENSKHICNIDIKQVLQIFIKTSNDSNNSNNHKISHMY
jgi:hypothetical protein